MDKRKRSRKRRPIVVSHRGRYRFQTGMVTAHLLEQGLSMDEALMISRALRDEVARHREITTHALERAIDALLAKHGLERRPEDDSSLRLDPFEADDPNLPSGDKLLRQLLATGIPPQEAIKTTGELVLELQTSAIQDLDQLEVEHHIAEGIRQRHGDVPARRYRMTRWLHRADRPVVLLIGGSTGTGKSTLATELAFRLGILMVVSTDMVRETMRTVLPAEVVPGLHDHSFRGMLQGGNILSDPRERVLAGFRQQAAQVAVGIRAVIRRAIKERSHIIVEGTHLIPPFEQYLPPGGVAYHAGLLLAVQSENDHLVRFPMRAKREPMRDPQAYLESYQAVRWIHDDLLQAAEDEGDIVVATDTAGDSTTVAIEYLSQALPISGQTTRPLVPGPVGARLPSTPTIFLVLDGLSDDPNPALDGKTPLGAAHTPFLDMLAASGAQGQVQTGPAPGEVPHSDNGLLALMGMPPAQAAGRGLYEALGTGVPLPQGAVVLRGNLATTVGEGSLVDRRAGRIREGTADLLAELQAVPLSGGIVGSIVPSLEHRVVVVLAGQGLSSQISDTDPGGSAAVQRVLLARPLDRSPEAARTVEALAELLAIAQAHLSEHPLTKARVQRGLHPANCVITRGAARVASSPAPTARAKGMALVAGCGTCLGVARAVGIAAVTGPGMTGNLDTNLDAKLDAAFALLDRHPLVYVHIKGTDIAAHDRRPAAKRDFIARVDQALGRLLGREEALGLRIAVSSDHGCSSVSGHHTPEPVPLLLAQWEGECEPTAFSEETAGRGVLGLLLPQELTEVLAAG